MDGKVLDGVFEPEFVRRASARYVASYETAKPDEKTATPSEDFGKDQLAETVAGLQALGYVEKEKKPGEGAAAGQAARREREC